MTALAVAARIIRTLTGTLPMTEEAQAAYIQHLHNLLEDAYIQSWTLLDYTQHDGTADHLTAHTFQHLDQITKAIGPNRAREIYNTII